MTDHSPNKLRPHGYWYFVSLLVLVAGFGLAYWQMGRSVNHFRDIVKPVGDQGLVQFDQAGTYALYITRGASQRMDSSANQAWSMAKTATISVRDDRTGSAVALTHAYETIDIRNTLVARLVEFEVPAPGTYRLQTTLPLGVLKPAVRPSVPVREIGNDAIRILVGMLVGLGIGVTAAVVAAIMFLVVLLQRRSFKKRFASSSFAGAERL